MDAPTLNGIAVCQSGGVYQPLEQTGASDMKVTTVGIDLAKNVFQLHGVNEFGKACRRRLNIEPPGVRTITWTTWS